MCTINAKVIKQNDNWWVEPILLDCDPVDVAWDLSEIFAYFGSESIDNVRIEFFQGPLKEVDPALGPFLSQIVFDRENKRLHGEERNQVHGIYFYNIFVTITTTERALPLFPFDPQIDNLAPPAPQGARTHPEQRAS